jgi:hypothetical protein
MSGPLGPTWGDAPFRLILPSLLRDMAIDAARAGGQGVPDLVSTAALMPDQSVLIQLSLDPRVPSWFTDWALAWTSVRSGDGSVLHDHVDARRLSATRVASWLRG